ncbi:MAG TPA: hypothetical protein P5537_06100 [Thauera sp.]|uniref:hypothetical protein n=1 Tax=Thauera sp. TaxID=1905334 RepID=UPI002C028528|nr:hypothetical protein [Thauera sp.]HRV77651.1 hypothetical protein [Thauera sp.]
MSIRPIRHPLPGERILALAPEDAAEAARWWLRRPNLFAGRTLTGPTLSARQDWAAAHVALRGRAFTAGVVQGLETALADVGSGLGGSRIALMQGSGLGASGEDVHVARAHEFELGSLPVVADPSAFSGLGGAGGGGAVLAGKIVGPALGEVVAAAPAALPRVGILVLQPVASERIGEFDLTDPCPLDACSGDGGAAFEDWRSGDAARLLWYAWPEEWRSLPPLPPAGAGRWRNLIAWRIFEAERGLGEHAQLPWAPWGVALGLVACAADWTPLFLDRASVVRAGARARWPRMGGGAGGLATHWRLPALWQAQIEQLAEQIAAAGDPPPPPASLGADFARLPPFGLLPAHVLELDSLRSDFFPGGFELDAAPIPSEQLDAALAEAAPLAPLDTSLGERVRLLVPVPQAVFEPRLLIRELIDPEFAATLAAFTLARARQLGARQGLRTRAALLARAISGRSLAVPEIAADAEALEPESLAPWGPPPAGGGHRATLRDGIHQHFFEAATETLAVAAGGELFAWVYLDPEQPPRTLMLQWHAGNWEHRAWWGEDLIPWGAAGTAAHARIGELPPSGRWVELRIPAALVGLDAQEVDGMAFTLFDGRAAWGITGSRAADGNARKWFCGVLPADARSGGDEAWTLLTHNDLWAPFERIDGVEPADGRGAPAGGGHAAPAAADGGITEYGLDGATAVLRADAGESLYAWVHLDPNAPPVQVLLEWHSSQGRHQAWWGLDRIPGASAANLVRTRAGALPRPARWVRLLVPAGGTAGIGMEGLEVRGMRFLLAGGGACFGATGVLDADGNERPWFAGSLPAGARQLGAWHFLGARDLLAPTSAGPRGQVAAALALYDDPLLGALSVHERYQIFQRGLEGFIAFLKARADRADDLVDFNFVKVQTDIYRVRQIILGTSAATRLAVSPALAAIAQSETAVASSARIAGFFDELKAEAATPGASADGGATAPARSALPGTTGAGLRIGGGTEAVADATRADKRTLEIDKSADTKLFIRAVSEPRYTVSAAGAFLPSDVTGGAPVVGRAEVRTVSIAERLQAPRATEAKDYTTATRHAAVSALTAHALALTAEDGGEVPGLFLDIDLYGTRGDPALFYASAEELEKNVRLPAIDSDNPEDQALLDARPRNLAFTRLLREPWRMPLLLRTPLRVRVDEATQFADGTDLADNTVALMRQLEGRIKRYRDAIAAGQRVLDALRGSARALENRLRAIGDELAEARHDVAVTRALIAEEEARLAAINDRRSRILRDHVHFIAYQRPREAESILPTAQRSLDPGLLAPAVPSCLHARQDAPDALRELLATVREAPARWFAHAPALLDRLDRSDLLIKALQSAQLRSQLHALKLAAQPADTPAKGVPAAIAGLHGRRVQAVQQARTASTRIDLAALATLGWKQARDEADKFVSLGDLIDGEHGSGAVASRAAALFDELSGIATCLHEAFCAVPPSIRLDWAERLSQFDATPQLRNLAGLARWGEIDFTARRRLQSLADWLFGQMRAGDVEAEALMNDIVHMTLLLASHAPVDRILSGRLPEPVTARPGIRLPIRVTEPLRLRVGMQALIYQADRVVARATVEDLAGNTAAAVVTRVEGDAIALAVETRVHFIDSSSPVALAGTMAGTRQG